jgi:hypothetical protein
VILLEWETFVALLDSKSKGGKQVRQLIRNYAIDVFLLPILPVAIKEGINGKVCVEDCDGTIRELVLQHFCDTSPDQETADKRMNDFLAKIKKATNN